MLRLSISAACKESTCHAAQDNHFSMPLSKSFQSPHGRSFSDSIASLSALSRDGYVLLARGNLETISFRAEKCWICDRLPAEEFKTIKMLRLSQIAAGSSR